MEEKPSYYAIIPANVRYDNNLKDKAKLLYGEITCLSNEKGYCYASNKYFADLYKISTVTAINLINNLVENGYIEKKIIYKEGTKEILMRQLKILDGGYLKKFEGGSKENFTYNNTSINNTSINNKNIIKSPEDFDLDKDLDKQKILEDDEYNFNAIWSVYPRKEGKTLAFKRFRSWLDGRKVNGRTVRLTDEQILNAVCRYSKEVQYTDMKYIKQGSTFFGDCLLDYVDDV